METYEEATSVKASKLLHNYKIVLDKSDSDHLVYLLFQSLIDFAFAQWFMSTKCMKRDINGFFKDERLKLIKQLLSFTNYDELMTKIHDILYGIKNDAQIVADIEVGEDILGSSPNQYQIRYRNVVTAIEFLMGHRPFVSHLAYAPI